MKWKWRRHRRDDYWQAKLKGITLGATHAQIWQDEKHVGVWIASTTMMSSWVLSRLYRNCGQHRDRRDAQRAAEQAVPGLLQDAYVAIRRKMKALGVEIPDGE